MVSIKIRTATHCANSKCMIPTLARHHGLSQEYHHPTVALFQQLAAFQHSLIDSIRLDYILPNSIHDIASYWHSFSVSCPNRPQLITAIAPRTDNYSLLKHIHTGSIAKRRVT